MVQYRHIKLREKNEFTISARKKKVRFLKGLLQVEGAVIITPLYRVDSWESKGQRNRAILHWTMDMYLHMHELVASGHSIHTSTYTIITVHEFDLDSDN